MIGKPQWFGPRKYTGWGFTPRSWQGWAYIALIFLLIRGIQVLPVAGDIKLYAMIAVGIIFAADFIHIVSRMRRDERERIHEAFAERNALWAIMLLLCVGVAYEAASTAASGTYTIDPWIIAALVVGIVVKAATNLYLDRKD